MTRLTTKMYTKVIIILVFTSKTFQSKVCDFNETVDISLGIHMPDGAIYFEGDRYENNEYYVNEDGVERGCVCSKKTCIMKCCPFGFGYDETTKVCVKTDAEFKPPVWNNYQVREGQSALSSFHFQFGKINCSTYERRLRIGQATDSFHLRQDGKLYINLKTNSPIFRGPDKYCIDTFISNDYETGKKVANLDALICFAEKQDEHHYVLSSTCMLISCVFFLATMAVYAWLPELRNLHGKVLMVYLMCLLIGFVFLSTMQILLTLDNISPKTCLTLTFIIYWSLESAFFWLNVMCFDIWWTFSGKRGPSSKLSTRARFIAYACYAFGIPTLLTILLVVLEFSGLPPHPLMPNLQHGGCFIYGASKLMYLYGPIIILCVANMVFFILTALKIAEIKKQTSVLKSKESSMHDQHRNDKQRLVLYLKLFAVMGINWIMEVISAIYPEIDDLWKVTDAYNVLIGLIVFIIFVCKRKIFRLIKKRMRSKTEQRSTWERSEGSHPDLKYKQLRGDPMSRTQTMTSTRTFSTRDEVQMGSIKSKM